MRLGVRSLKEQGLENSILLDSPRPLDSWLLKSTSVPWSRAVCLTGRKAEMPSVLTVPRVPAGLYQELRWLIILHKICGILPNPTSSRPGLLMPESQVLEPEARV